MRSCGNIGLLFDLEVCDSRDLLHYVADASSHLPQLIQVGSEDLDRDVGPRAGKHVIDAVPDRLADRDVCARNGGKLTPELAEHGLLVDIRVECDVNLSGVHSLRMFVEFGASLPPIGVSDGRIGEENLFDTLSNRVGFVERCPGHRDDGDGQRTFIELRQE
jgi:hypothetical protein